MSRLTCLIPAWNEAERLPAVLRAALGHPMLDRVLVVDDGSTDGTARIARAMGAEVLALPVNGGKTAALAAGIAALRGEHVMLLDADLVGLTAQDITRLAAPVLVGQAQATLSLRGNAPGLWQALGVDYISGERVLPVALLKEVAPHLSGLPAFGFEVFLNRALKSRDARVAVVGWRGVSSPWKAQKQGLWRGLVSDAGMIRDILRCQPPGELVSQIRWLCAQIDRQNRTCSAIAAQVSPATRPNQTPMPSQPTMKPSA
ncbi:glycosyltransferase [Rhodobacter sp. NTK016B]|uniref:glycosyltransferase family 2 protein n=1 Tax=Rhodobacter sp. NTK016B TaxID=2759676 RepID=UPI001A8FFF04|nr:glycosyltransferase [Rhodobacter sp. NTK016B]MBN8293463.1 glycosyltransferase [Rhodobacter sp. NTK016B]